MTLVLLHPALTKFSCSDCQQFVYDFETGERTTYAAPDGTRLDATRPAVCPPPCRTCPKEGPEHEHEHLLSEANWQTLELYRQVRATGGACLWEHERQDEMLAHNMGLIDVIIRDAEERKRASK